MKSVSMDKLVLFAAVVNEVVKGVVDEGSNGISASHNGAKLN